MKRHFRILLWSVFIFCLVTFVSSTGNSQTPSPTETPWTAKEFRLIDRSGEIVEVLPNGMVAIVKENHTAPVAAVRLHVRAGSIYEEGHLGGGLSHLFEHLLAGGATQQRTEEASRKLIEKIGAQYNAGTGKASTSYFLTVPALHVGTALNLIADWVTRPTFPEEAFKREWGVVQRELEMTATDPDWAMYQLYNELRYKVHPARYPIIGHQSILKQVTRADVLDYYRRMYVPDNCVVVIVGHVNAEEMLQAIKKEFADFTRRARPNIVLPEEPEITASREIVKVFPALRGPTKMQIGFPSFPLQHPDLYALDTLADIMGSGRSSRLYQRLREKEQLVLSVRCYNDTPSWGSGTFTLDCELEAANIPPARRAIREEIERIQKEGVTEKELARAKRQLQGEHIRRHQTAEQQARAMAEDYLATGDPHFSDHYVDKMQKVTEAQIQAAARTYFDRDKQLTLILTGKPLSTTAKETEKKSSVSDIKKITLDNGLRVLLKHNPAVPLVNVQLYVRGGLLDETDANNGLTHVMTQLSAKGTQRYTAQQIYEYFDGIGGVLETGCGNNTFYFRMEIMPQDLAQALSLFGEVVMSPTFPEDELTKLKPLVLATIEQVHNSWPLEGERFFREKFFVNSPYKRIRLGTVESVKRIDRAEITAFHQQAVGGVRSVLAVFGDIDMAAVEGKVRELFSPMGKGESPDLNRIKPEPTHSAARTFMEKTTKEGATVHVGFPGMKITNVQDRYPMEVLMGIIGRQTGRLHELLRGKGLVYYAWGYSFAGLSRGYIVATAQCEAEKAPEVLALIKDQLAKAARGEIVEEEAARAKSYQINTEILNKQTNADAAMTAALDELYGFGYNWSDGHADRIMGVTLDQVKAVAKKYLSVPLTVTIKTSKPELFKEKPVSDQSPSVPAESKKSKPAPK